MDAVKSGITAFEPANDTQRAQLRRLEEKIKRRMHIGAYMSQRRLLDEMSALGESEQLVWRALVVMQQAGEVEFRRERSLIHRVK